MEFLSLHILSQSTLFKNGNPFKVSKMSIMDNGSFERLSGDLGVEKRDYENKVNLEVSIKAKGGHKKSRPEEIPMVIKC